MENKYIVLIVGESGSGKSTICNELTKRYDLKQVESYTTRPRRNNEERGHTFVTEEEFNKLQNICAYTLFDSHKYCATKEQIDSADLYIIDPHGIDYFMRKYNGQKIPMVVYIHASQSERKKRMRYRGDTEYQINRRIRLDVNAFYKAQEYAIQTYRNEKQSDIDNIVTDIYQKFFDDDAKE